MLRNYLAAAIRNLWRNRLYSALNIAGLAAGFTAGLLIALYVHDEETFDRFWPHYGEAYMASTTLALAGQSPWVMDGAPAQVIAVARPKLPAGVVVARVMEETHAVRRGQQEANEQIRWADPELFSVLRPVLISGDLDGALVRPDGLVLTQHIARKYFGDASPLGQSVTIDREHDLTVRAVVRDLPASSSMKADMFGSGRAGFAGVGAKDIQMQDRKNYAKLDAGMETYVRAPSQAVARQAERVLQASADEIATMVGAKDWQFKTQLLPVTAIHLSPPGLGLLRTRGEPALLAALALIGIGVVAMAAINFINLMTARATRRATEIGVRKAQGATPGDLVLQFIGESVLYCLIAMLLAVAAVEVLLPAFNSFLQRDITLPYAEGLAFCAVVALVTGVAAGAYPALVLARFSPAAVLRGVVKGGAGGRVRQVLVVLQFAVLISLMLATLVVYRQVRFALGEGLRFDTDQVLVIETSCKGAFLAEVRKLPGVRAAACSGGLPVGYNLSTSGAIGPDGAVRDVRNEAVSPGQLELYGIRPVAGRFFAQGHPEENLARQGDEVFSGPVVLNETAVRKLHYESAQAAVGQVLRHPHGPNTRRTDVSTIIGVAPDVLFDSVRDPVAPTVFHTDTADFHLLSVKLAGRQVPETLGQIDGLWKPLGEPRPIERTFVTQVVQERCLDAVRQGQMFAAFAGVALLIACLGLFGLAAFTAERRIKEIGVRKALGASGGQIMGLLLWDLSGPVLLANLIAWPVGLYLMSRWLAGFAYHISLDAWMLGASGLFAVIIAWATVSTHAVLVARARPAAALRYE